MEHIILDIMETLLKEKRLHLRGIAKKLKKPHATVSRAIKVLLKENIIEFSIVGRNKYFSIKSGIEALNYIYMVESNKLIELCKKHQFISVILEELSKKTDRLTILFGSYAKKTEKKDSDIDIFVETSDKNLRKELANIHSKLSIKIGKFDKGNLLVKEIIKDHVIIKGVEKFYEKIKIFD